MLIVDNRMMAALIVLTNVIIIGVLVVGALYFVGASYYNGYETGVSDSIDYTQCVYDSTPLYEEPTDSIFEDCAEKNLEDFYWK